MSSVFQLDALLIPGRVQTANRHWLIGIEPEGRKVFHIRKFTAIVRRSILNGLTLDMEESSQAWEPVWRVMRLLRPARGGIFLRSRAGYVPIGGGRGAQILLKCPCPCGFDRQNRWWPRLSLIDRGVLARSLCARASRR